MLLSMTQSFPVSMAVTVAERGHEYSNANSPKPLQCLLSTDSCFLKKKTMQF
jgi:hypothetical protein